MNFWWRLAIAAVILLVLLDAGYYVRGKFDEAAQADVLREQIKATAARIDQQNAVAKQAEEQLQTDRTTIAALNKKWNAIRAQKDRTACQLDAGTIRVLKDATSGDASAR